MIQMPDDVSDSMRAFLIELTNMVDALHEDNKQLHLKIVDLEKQVNDNESNKLNK